MDGEQEHDLATCWEVRQDEASSQVYYWNAVTGETSWEPPPHLATSEELVNTGELAPPWTQAFDGDGRFYYLNTETMETRWTPPPPAVEQQENALIVSESDVLAVAGGRGRRPSTAEQMNDLNRLLSGEGEDAGELGESEQEAGEAAPLLTVEEKTAADADGCVWMMFINEDDGVPYYYNQISGECLWDPPEEFLRFHQEQLQDIDETTVAVPETEPPAPPTSSDNGEPQGGSADSMTESGAQDDGSTQVVTTPEFGEKVHQAIAAAWYEPTRGNRHIRVLTPTQQQLAPRTGRSAGDGTSARSRPSSARPRSGSSFARPRSGSSRPSSGGAVSRPQTPATSSGLEPILPTEGGSSALEEGAAARVESEPQGERTVVREDDLPARSEQSDEGQFPLIIQANGAEDSESSADVLTDEETTIDSAAMSLAEADTNAETDTADNDMILLASAERILNNGADNDRKKAKDTGAAFQGFIDAAVEVEVEAGLIIEVEAATTETADVLPDPEVLPERDQIAALALQCMVRCFIARQRVKRKREERQSAIPIEILPENRLPEHVAIATIAAAASSKVDNEKNSTALPAQETPQEKPSLDNTVPSPPSEDNEDSSVVPSSVLDQQNSVVSARTDTSAVSSSVETPPSARPAVLPLESSRRRSSSTPTEKKRPRASISTRLPSVLDVTKYFPQRSSLTSPRLAHSEGLANKNDQVAITRKKIDLRSPRRTRRASQQEAAGNEQLLETRRKEEERTERAQVANYQRIYMESRKSFKAEAQRLQDEKRSRDNQRQHDAQVEKRARIQAQHEKDAARARNRTAGDETNRLVWEHFKTPGRPTEQSVSQFQDALKQALDSAHFPNKMCAERARELQERIKILHRASWAVDSQLEEVELRLLSELHPLTDRQRPLQVKYVAKLRCRLEQMLDMVQSWQRVIDERESGTANGSISSYWSTIQAGYAPSSAIASSDESRHQYVLNTWRGAAGGDSLLHVAAWNGWEEHVRLLIEKGADADMIDSSASHRTPLHEACLAGHIPVIELLLRSGALLNAVDVSGDSPLHVACRGGWTRVTRILLMAANDLGEEIDPSIADSRTPLRLEDFFNLRNGKGRRAIEVATLPSLKEELQNYDYQLNGVAQQSQQTNGEKQRQQLLPSWI
ncbi:hypothetical protein PHYPSEUDO_013980 [Phytophthora pseudosyringae]|uniref:WW domain-containing protein n=1 Tax=Phytophthora pseudosyringae TaxID=221518 RepID=A0A8T1W2W5_9STRA|nr:hypothetical protein PHYPSEUDO_013980 [Phytophthora pseudosyringae]